MQTTFRVLRHVINELLGELERCLCSGTTRRPPSFRFIIGPITERTMPMPPDPVTPDLILTDSQRAVLTIAPKDKAGNDAVVDNVRWSSSDPLLLDVQASEDGLTCTVVTKGPLGTAQVSVVADADLGPDQTDIAGVINVTVRAGQAVSVGITAGTPTENP